MQVHPSGSVSFVQKKDGFVGHVGEEVRHLLQGGKSVIFCCGLEVICHFLFQCISSIMVITYLTNPSLCANEKMSQMDTSQKRC